MLIAKFNGTPEIKAPLCKLASNNHKIIASSTHLKNSQSTTATKKFPLSSPATQNNENHSVSMKLKEGMLEEQFKAACEAIQNLPKNGTILVCFLPRY
jgi:hypothetical protein